VWSNYRFIPYILFLAILTGPIVSCKAKEETAIENTSITTIDTVDITIDEPEYLDALWMHQYAQKCPTLDSVENYPPPFNTLVFNKVIAYDFDGHGERHPTVFDMEGGGFASTVIHQTGLGFELVNELISMLTDKDTYGERINACYEPHLGFIFYADAQPKAVIDICLDCNFLKSTITIPATSHHVITYDTGVTQPLIGFSTEGVERIIALSTKLNLDYRSFNH
jgi:hypothetical protein